MVLQARMGFSKRVTRSWRWTFYSLLACVASKFCLRPYEGRAFSHFERAKIGARTKKNWLSPTIPDYVGCLLSPQFSHNFRPRLQNAKEVAPDVLITFCATRVSKLKFLQRIYGLVSAFATPDFAGFESQHLQYFTQRAKDFTMKDRLIAWQMCDYSQQDFIYLYLFVFICR